MKKLRIAQHSTDSTYQQRGVDEESNGWNWHQKNCNGNSGSSRRTAISMQDLKRKDEDGGGNNFSRAVGREWISGTSTRLDFELHRRRWSQGYGDRSSWPWCGWS